MAGCTSSQQLARIGAHPTSPTRSAGDDVPATPNLLAASTLSGRVYSIGPALGLPDRYEDSARALRADLTVNQLAGVGWLELRTLFTPLLAIGVILIGHGLL